MGVRAKFVCNAVQDMPEHEQKQVSLSPVINGSEENKSFSKYTPSGSVNLSISNESQASNYFVEGKEYFIDFNEVD